MTTLIRFYLTLPLLWPWLAVAYYFVYREYGMDGVREVRKTRQMPAYAAAFGFAALELYWLFLVVLVLCLTR